MWLSVCEFVEKTFCCAHDAQTKSDQQVPLLLLLISKKKRERSRRKRRKKKFAKVSSLKLIFALKGLLLLLLLLLQSTTTTNQCLNMHFLESQVLVAAATARTVECCNYWGHQLYKPACMVFTWICANHIWRKKHTRSPLAQVISVSGRYVAENVVVVHIFYFYKFRLRIILWTPSGTEVV